MIFSDGATGRRRGMAAGVLAAGVTALAMAGCSSSSSSSGSSASAQPRGPLAPARSLLTVVISP